MKWIGRRESGNVEDRRGMSGGKLAAGGGVIGLVVLLINMFMGGDSGGLLNGIQDQMQQGQPQQTVPLSEADQQMGKFVAVVVADTEDVWRKIFQENGLTYREPTLVMFRDGVETGCGNATSAAGPFYCPADEKVYMDMAFFDELKTRFGAKGGDFAIAYVIAHEIGHHVQNLLGVSEKISQMQSQAGEAQANKLSVGLELQADFYAGVFSHYEQSSNKVLDEGDIDEALSAANAVGDDAIQSKMQGSINQESFTHGSSEQRKYWFTRGFNSGDIRQGNTFAELNQ